MPLTVEPTVQHLYVHVPFCAHKCLYCAFYSEVPGQGEMDRYINALLQELEWVADVLRPRTIFIGGGTPTLLATDHWKTILRQMERLHLLGAEEFTVECNPATVDRDKARLLRAHGVNRISMGIQALDNRFLERLGRIHSRAQALASFDLLRAAGFDNINLDLMFAIPGQTLDLWSETLRETIALGSEHLSCYEVTYEEDTPLFEQLQAGKVDVNEDLACEMYDRLVEMAETAGVHRYEISNFARDRGSGVLPSFACQHNVNYWRGGSYYGLGPSATSYVRGQRWKNVAESLRYCEMIEKGRRPIEAEEILPPLQRAGEIAAFGLRMTMGWPFEQFQTITGYDLRQDWRAEIEQLVRNGLGEVDEAGFRLTPKGLRFADHAAEMFIRLPEDEGRGQP